MFEMTENLETLVPVYYAATSGLLANRLLMTATRPCVITSAQLTMHRYHNNYEGVVGFFVVREGETKSDIHLFHRQTVAGNPAGWFKQDVIRFFDNSVIEPGSRLYADLFRTYAVIQFNGIYVD